MLMHTPAKSRLPCWTSPKLRPNNVLHELASALIGLRAELEVFDEQIQKMDHSHMNHGDMEHGDMDMGGQCNMNVWSLVPYDPRVGILMNVRCYSPGLLTICALFSANGESRGPCL
jgi:hypothetical protein